MTDFYICLYTILTLQIKEVKIHLGNYFQGYLLEKKYKQKVQNSTWNSNLNIDTLILTNTKAGILCRFKKYILYFNLI